MKTIQLFSSLLSVLYCYLFILGFWKLILCLVYLLYRIKSNGPILREYFFQCVYYPNEGFLLWLIFKYFLDFFILQVAEKVILRRIWCRWSFSSFKIENDTSCSKTNSYGSSNEIFFINTVGFLLYVLNHLNLFLINRLLK